MVGVFAQPVGPTYRPVAYLSKQLDPTLRGWQPCLRALGSAAELGKEALKLTLCQPVTIFSSHRLTDLLSRRALSLLSPSHLQEFDLLFVEGTALSLQLSLRLNPATLLPTPTTDTEPAHSCPEVLHFLGRPLDRTSDKPLPEADLTLFVDGSLVLRADGRRQAAYAVVTLTDTLEANKLPEGTTSQKAELIALARALTLARGK